MVLEHVGMPQPGDCRVVFSASAEELEAAIQAEQAAENPPQAEEDLLTAAVNRAILTGFSTLYQELVEKEHLVPVTDPDFELLAVNRAEGFRAGAEFYCLPPLELERYTGLVQQIKEKSKERKTLVVEKKALPIYHVKRHKALAVRIAELTEDLEELRSEKALLFQKLEYAEDAGAEEFRKDIATMEAGLKKLEAQEQRYSAELDKALSEYADLKAQASDFDPVELYKARQAIRPAQEKAVEAQLEETSQHKPSLRMLLSAKQEASRLIGENAEERQARQMSMQRQAAQQKSPLRSVWKKNDFER